MLQENKTGTYLVWSNSGPFNSSRGRHTSTQHIFVEILLLLIGFFKDESADLSQLLGKMWLIHQPVEIEVKPRRTAMGIEGETDWLNSNVFKICQSKQDFLPAET